MKYITGVDLPILSAISATRSPQMPLMATRTLSPGSTVLNTAHSMAACPEPLMAKVMLFCVWKAYWIPFLMSFMICKTANEVLSRCVRLCCK